MTSIITVVQVNAVLATVIFGFDLFGLQLQEVKSIEAIPGTSCRGKLRLSTEANRQSIYLPDANWLHSPRFPPGIGKDEADFISASPPV